jgi:predicted transcriptional regulator
LKQFPLQATVIKIMRTQKCHISEEHIASILEVLDTSISKPKKTITYIFTASNLQVKTLF